MVAVGGWWVVGGALQGVDLQVFGIPCHIASRQPAGGVLPCANPPRCNITCSTPSRFDSESVRPRQLDFALRRGTFNGGGGSAATKSASGPGSASTFALRLGPSNAQQFRGAPWRLSPIPRPDQFLITRRNKLDLKSMRLRLGWVLACVSHED